MSFGYVEGESLLMGLKKLLCRPARLALQRTEPSYVLKALGVSGELAIARSVSAGRFTTWKKLTLP
jgi:hypothetical protein